jgi:hypothetical protein
VLGGLVSLFGLLGLVMKDFCDRFLGLALWQSCPRRGDRWVERFEPQVVTHLYNYSEERRDIAERRTRCGLPSNH